MSFQGWHLAWVLLGGAVPYAAGYVWNALWQAPLLFAGAAVGARLLRRHSVLAVHRVWAIALVFQAVLPALAMVFPPNRLAAGRLVAALFGTHGAATSSSVTVTLGAATVQGGAHLPFVLLQGVAVTLGAWLLFGGVRLLSGLRRTARLLRVVSAPEGAVLVQASWERCCERFGTSGATLLESPDVRTPLTFGLRRQRVLVPLGLLQNLDEDELWTMFSHECVHIQRRDFAWNLLYEVLALPISWHPLMRLTRTRLVESREWVCDALAAATSPQPRLYARCLLRLATLLLQQQDAPAEPLHAIGMLDANALERRIMQLTTSSPFRSLPRRIAAVAVVGLVGLGTCACAWAFSTDGKGAPASRTHPAAAGTKVDPGVMAGQTLTRVNPEYPEDAKKAHLEGSVVLKAQIGADGKIDNLTIQSGDPTLGQAALDAVRQWTYKPYVMNGQPVVVETTITVNFKLND